MAEENQNEERENGSAHDDASPEAVTAEIDIESDAFAELPWEEQIDHLKGMLQDTRAQVAQNLDLAQRAQAEMANSRRRADEERISLGKYSNSRLIAKLLPVVEELDLAMGHAGGPGTGPASGDRAGGDSGGGETSGQVSQAPDASPAGSSWMQGVKLIQRKFITLLESEGVTAIDAVGTVFNPLEHEALGTDESSEYPPGYVIQAVRQGYRLHDRIIQPAQVIVAKEPQRVGTGDTSSEAEETDNG